MGLILNNGGMWVQGIYLLVFFGVIGTLVWGAVAAIQNRGSHGSHEPEQILKQRLARGEISEAEYLRLQSLILGDHSHRLM